MKINEIFESINGEGKFAGLRTTFVRTFGCNIKCSYCDTQYACVGNDYSEMSIDDILRTLNKYNCQRVTLTGGEPLLQPDAIDLLKALSSIHYLVEIETNGAVDLTPFVSNNIVNIMFTMDWKCPSSSTNDKMVRKNLGLLTENDVIKFVVGCQEDLYEMLKIAPLTRASVFVSPVFGQIEPQEIVQFILDNKLDNVRLQLQQHKIIWDPNTRGV